MRVQKEEILKMAKLARLEITDDEVVRMQGSLGELLEYLDVLKQLDLKDVEPMTAVDSAPRPLRPDVEKPMLSKEQALRNAPEINLEHFSIPKVIGG